MRGSHRTAVGKLRLLGDILVFMGIMMVMGFCLSYSTDPKSAVAGAILLVSLLVIPLIVIVQVLV